MNIREQDLHIEFFRASGPGGQHRNRRETGVRIRHLPSGIVVIATERRSQQENRRVAMERLQRALARLERRRNRRVPTRPSSASRERRMAEKKRRGVVKAQRRKTLAED